LKFEGEYLDGDRHGKGKEYGLLNALTIILLFEGEYFHGNKWNGKGYNYNGDLIFELRNGCGKVKEYGKYNRLIFEGEYLNGERQGEGKEYLYDFYGDF